MQGYFKVISKIHEHTDYFIRYIQALFYVGKHLNQEHPQIVLIHQMKVYVVNGYWVLRVIHPLIWASRLCIFLLGNQHWYAVYIMLSMAKFWFHIAYKYIIFDI